MTKQFVQGLFKTVLYLGWHVQGTYNVQKLWLSRSLIWRRLHL